MENPGGEAMPFCIGGHTAFRCPIRPGASFEDYRLVFEREEDAWALLPGADGCLNPDHREHFLPGTDTIPLRHEVFDRVDTLIFEMCIRDRKGGILCSVCMECWKWGMCPILPL